MAKPHRISSAKQLEQALSELQAADRRLAALLARSARPKFVPRRRHGFEALMEIVVSQQLSAAAADTIFGRLKQKVTPFAPAAVLAADAATLRACGLSAPKQRHMKAIAAAVLDGSLDLDRIRRMADEEAHAHLTAVKGIGPWTADIYLMSSLGRADIWPVGDVSLQAAVARALNLRKRPDEKAMERLSRNWKPWRTVAARLLWTHEDQIRRVEREKSRAKPNGKRNPGSR